MRFRTGGWRDKNASSSLRSRRCAGRALAPRRGARGRPLHAADRRSGHDRARPADAGGIAGKHGVHSADRAPADSDGLDADDAAAARHREHRPAGRAPRDRRQREQLARWTVGDLDRGAALWLVIAPRYDLSRADPLTNVDPVAGTGHAKPLPQATEVEIGDHLSLAVPAQVRRNDVPGIDPVTSGSGNRALWFEQK